MVTIGTGGSIRFMGFGHGRQRREARTLSQPIVEGGRKGLSRPVNTSQV